MRSINTQILFFMQHVLREISRRFKCQKQKLPGDLNARTETHRRFKCQNRNIQEI